MKYMSRCVCLPTIKIRNFCTQRLICSMAALELPTLVAHFAAVIVAHARSYKYFRTLRDCSNGYRADSIPANLTSKLPYNKILNTAN